MVYVDTSVFVSILTNESAAARSAQWLGQEKPGSVFISGWTIAEFSSALSLKLRTRQIDHSQRQVAMTAFQRLVAQSLSIVTIDAQHYHAAAGFCDREDLALRAADSMHLAIAIQRSLTLATLDTTLAKACKAIGHPCTQP